MNNYRKIINEFKSSKNTAVLIDFRCIHNGKEGYEETGDKNYLNRKHLILELYENYSAEDKPLIKWLLKEELKGFEFGIPVYTTDLCAFMLYKHMTIEDIYDVYDAKFGAGSDHQFYIDIELVFGFDKDETKTFLKNAKTQRELNNEMLKTIEWYESNPDAKFKTREEYIEYFETKKVNNIKADLED